MLRAIYPSALHWAAVCPRRFVGMHGAEQLPPTLGAVRGRILHAVREDLAAHPDRSAAGLRAAAESAFVAARTQEQQRLAKRSWWTEWFDLAEHLPWRSARSLVLPLANRLARMAVVPHRSRHQPKADAEWPAVREEEVADSLDPLPGVEVQISCAELRLRGIIDEVRATAGGWVVVEMKTTDRTAGGDAAKTQVLAYALALELLGAGRVSHCEVLGPRGPKVVKFDESARRHVSNLLGVARETDGSVALPGQSACGGCPVRDACSAYADWTEHQWTEQQPVVEYDVWGVVDLVEPSELATMTVGLRRPDETRVLIRGVPSSRTAVTTGANVAAYGLRATGTRLHGVETAPTALHERPVGVASGLPPAWGALWQLRGRPRDH
jgi:CRISPR/Cas system-associated exonuclease Cas4 (RecB family)